MRARGGGVLNLADWQANFAAHFPASASSTTVPESLALALLIRQSKAVAAGAGQRRDSQQLVDA